MDLLLTAGADADEAEDAGGYTPLAVAAQNGHAKIVLRLVAAGADKDLADNNGVTPLFFAALNGRLEVGFL